jgi:uncharacterized protein (UPF0264 family)
MTRLLVSVRSASEAILAANHGAHLIDVKEPAQGSLGAASPDVWHEVLAALGKQVSSEQVSVSAALGELRASECFTLASHTARLTFAKVGLATCRDDLHWPARWHDWRRSLATGTSAVAVIYADWQTCAAPAPRDVLEHLVLPGHCAAVLVDTYDKSRGSLLAHYPLTELQSLAEQVRAAACQLVLAGSLTLDIVPTLLPLAPDYLAVRGAVCRASRAGHLDGALVREWTRALSGAPVQCQPAR